MRVSSIIYSLLLSVVSVDTRHVVSCVVAPPSGFQSRFQWGFFLSFFWHSSKYTYYCGYNSNFHILYLFQLPGKVLVFLKNFLSPSQSLCGLWRQSRFPFYSRCSNHVLFLGLGGRPRYRNHSFFLFSFSFYFSKDLL